MDLAIVHPTVVLRVLVADGAALANEGLIAMLADLDGISVFGCAQEPAKVLALIQSVRPDVVVLDLQLPGEKGVQLIRHIKVEWPGLIVMVLSHYGLTPIREGCLKAGADYFFEKSTELASLVETLETMLRSKQS